MMVKNPDLFVSEQVKNTEQKWFVLKDKKLLCRAKGAILLELDVIYNPVGIIYLVIYRYMFICPASLAMYHKILLWNLISVKMIFNNSR